MLARWLDRGLGQILAPDEKVAAEPKQEEANASFWRLVAPDPVWEASQHGPAPVNGAGAPPNKATAKTFRRQGSVPPPRAFSLASPPEMPKEVVCQNCNRVTPVILDPSTPKANKAGETPEFMSPLEKQVLVAAKKTTESILSPSYVTDARNKVFRLCASGKPLQEKLLQKLGKILQHDPSLLSSRASTMGNLVPDGLTPLMAAAYVNQVDAAKLIVELDPITKVQVDLQGRTALHIAAEMGSLDVVRLLQSNDTLGAKAPLDLLGNTPLGRAVTSHQKSARMAQSQLTQVLFSPGDPSVCGAPTPSRQRAATSTGCSVPVGYAQMPGFRVKMEDALSIHSWEGHALVGVCDGHGDSAQVSTLVATEVKDVYKLQPSELPQDERWTYTCLALDETVRKAGHQGGSTGVWACITESEIVVVNVGDCRCILVQEKEDDVLKKMEMLRIDEGVQEASMVPTLAPEGETKPSGAEENVAVAISSIEDEIESTKGGQQTSESVASKVIDASSLFVVTALSTDHKPDLALEQARIEGAGMTVMQDTFYDEHGLKQTIPKILLGPGHMMAVSRAFGDFEYKSNPGLTLEQQAVTAIPEVTVQTRSSRDWYLILACDGIWDVMTNSEVGDFVVQQANKLVAADEADVLPKVGDLLLAECLKLGSKDNMSVVIVSLSGTSKKVGASGVMEGKALRF
jgi:serine/threonine protein phosphatase PrpC